jgi:hypothetical protein
MVGAVELRGGFDEEEELRYLVAEDDQLNVCSLSVFVPVLNVRLANVKLTPRVHG